MIDGLKAEYRDTIIDILAANERVERAVLFGSRAMETFTPASDVDIALFGDRLTLTDQANLAAAIDELPMAQRVDLLLHKTVNNDALRKHIEQHGVEWYRRRAPEGSEVATGEQGNEWTSCQLEDCMEAIIDYRGKTPQKTSSGIPLITAKIVKGGRIEEPTEFIAIEDYDLWMRRGIPRPGDVLITTEAPLGEVAQLRQQRIALAQRLILLRGKSGILDNQFLKFLMQSASVQDQLRARATGTTVLGIKQKELRQIKLASPPIQEQRAIAHVLGTLDDKIELNRRMNETLEEMARTLFKSWFIDFDPVHAKATLKHHAAAQITLPLRGSDWSIERAHAYLDRMDPDIATLFPDSFVGSELGQIPAGWQVSEISQIADVIDCLHSKKPERQVQGRPLLQLWNIRDDGLLDMADAYLIDDPDYEQWTSRMEAVAGDCVITNVGRVGAVAQVPIGLKTALGRNMTGIRCKESSVFPTFLIECLLSQAMRNEISLNMDTGTILEALNVRNIPKLRFVLGTNRVLSSFEQRVRPLRARMEKNLSESRTLTALRDTLLPKLMSGELRVKNQK